MLCTWVQPSDVLLRWELDMKLGIVWMLLIAGTANATTITLTGQVVVSRGGIAPHPELQAEDRATVTIRLKDGHSESEQATQQIWNYTVSMDGRTSGNQRGHVGFASTDSARSVTIQDDRLDVNEERYDNLILQIGTMNYTVFDATGQTPLAQWSGYGRVEARSYSHHWLDGTRLVDIPTADAIGDLRFLAEAESSESPEFWIYVEQMTVAHEDLVPGDANADGVFDQMDIVEVLAAGPIVGQAGTSWAQGDWTADGRFNQLDIIAALPNYGTAPQAAHSAVAVPEPMALTLLAIGLASLAYRRRRR